MSTDSSTLRDELPGRREDLLPARNWGWFLARGILALLLGVLAVIFPVAALIASALVFAAFAFVDGVSQLIAGIAGATEKRERWWALILAGLVGIAVGVLYVVWPMLSTISYALVSLALLSAWAIITGVLQIAAAIRLRKQIEGEWLLAIAGLLSIVLGVAIIWVSWTVPAASIVSVGWIIGVWALIAGIAHIALALRLRKEAKRTTGSA